MRIAVLAFAIVVSFQGALVAQDDPAKLLTMLERPSRSERDTTLRRFRFVLPRIVLSCSDVTAEIRASDYIAKVYQLLSDRGLEREDGGYLGIANTFHGMLSKISIDEPIQCSEMWGLYLTMRENGESPEKAQGATVALYRSLLR